MGYIDPPSQTRDSQTSGAYTRQCEKNWPDASSQHIAWLGELLDCDCLEKTDEKGMNILHHLFQVTSSCALAINVAKNLARSDMPQLTGTFRSALKQKTTGLDPHSWTPLHFLCHGSDTGQKKADLINTLLHAKLVQPSDFDVTTGNVTVFQVALPTPFIYCFSQSKAQTCDQASCTCTGFRPSSIGNTTTLPGNDTAHVCSIHRPIRCCQGSGPCRGKSRSLQRGR